MMETVKICHREEYKYFSRLVMGTDHLGQLGEEKVVEMLDLAVGYGINAFDTAPIYRDGIERILGRWIKAKKKEDADIVLYTITKGGFPFDQGAGGYNSRLKDKVRDIIRNISEELTDSLSNLRKIDIYLMHRDDVDYRKFKMKDDRTQTPVEKILAALSDQQIRNNYEWIGVSNWKTERVNEAIQVAKDQKKNLLQPVINSPYFSLFEMSEKGLKNSKENFTIHSGGVQVTHHDMMNKDFQNGIIIMPYSPLGGFNIVERSWEKAKEDALRLHKSNDRYWGNVWEAIFDGENGKDNEMRYERAQEIIERLSYRRHDQNYTLDQLLNAYVLAHPRVNLLAIGPLKPDHLRQTVQSLRLADRLKDYPAILHYLYDGTGIDKAFKNLGEEFIGFKH